MSKELNIYLPEFIPYYFDIAAEYKLNYLEALIYGFIRFYTRNSQYHFYFQNKQLANAFRKNETYISETINSLIEKGLISAEYETVSTGGKNRNLKVLVVDSGNNRSPEKPTSEKPEVPYINNSNTTNLVSNKHREINVGNTNLVDTMEPLKDSLVGEKSSKKGLHPCSNLEKWEIAKKLNIPLSAVNDKHKQIGEMIESGYFKSKYKHHKTVYYTMLNWLRGDMAKGYIRECNEFEAMDLENKHPDNVAKLNQALQLIEEKERAQRGPSKGE